VFWVNAALSVFGAVFTWRFLANLKMASLALCAFALLVGSSSAFVGAPRAFGTRSSVSMAATETAVLKRIDSPDFYWKCRIEKLAKKTGGSYAFNADNYPDCAYGKEQFKAYYLDLALSGKLENYNVEEDTDVSDEEWQTIYNDAVAWSKKTVRENKPSAASLPTSEFDLLRQFYPSVDLREMETPFVEEEVGKDFPYRTMKDMLDAASTGKFSIPGYAPPANLELEVTGSLAKLDQIEAEAIARLDKLQDEVMSVVLNPMPDETSKAHYRQMRELLKATQTDRAVVEKEVEEMARLMNKKDDHHHHHEEEGHHEEKMSPAQEFEMKFGQNYAEFEERYALYKSNPSNFMEKLLEKKHGKTGVEVWKKSLELDQKLTVMSEAEQKALRAEYEAFLAKA